MKDGEKEGRRNACSDEGLLSIARERYTVLCRGEEGEMRISGYSIRSYNC